MTHKDIYTKFMIEYDKANVTSSYPSLTEYEVATVLDKAYNALIAQKVTGNNVRRSTFESDIKSIADLGPLTKTSTVDLYAAPTIAPNVSTCQTPDDLLYFLQATITDKGGSFEGYDRFENTYNPVDGQSTRQLPVKLVNHEAAQKFFASSYNIPWIKNPVCYIEDRQINVVYDSLSTPVVNTTGSGQNINHAPLNIVYIRKPNLFAKDLSNLGDFLSDDDAASQVKTISYFDWQVKIPTDDMYNSDYATNAIHMLESLYKFECNDTVAEELISLAVTFALENVESQRLNSKLNMRGLEA